MRGNVLAMAMVTEGEREIVVERTFDAPRPLVWQAFTRVEHLAEWWGPTGFTTTTEKMDFRVGGVWTYMMHGPDGTDYPNEIRYEAIEEPSLIAFRHSDRDGTEPACHANTITLDDVGGGRTRVRMRLEFPTKELKDTVVREYGAIEGGKQTMAHLAEYLETLREGTGNTGAVFTVRRVFDAPVELVWEAWTRPEHMKAWFHPEVWRLSVCEMDLRPGGSHFYCMSGESMPDMWGLWKIRVVEAPSRLEFVSSFCDKDRKVVRAPFSADWPLETMTVVTFEVHAGKGGGTVVTVRSWPIDANGAERAAFEGMIPSMNIGWGQTLDQLVGYLPEM